ncbi:MAG: glycoside hydrolase family 3 C-terminal domain-containing protein [Ilumatobacteraceae bacterium]
MTTTTADGLLDQLSLDQKIALLAGADAWHTAAFDDPEVPAIRMSDGPAGVRGTSWSGAASASFPCGTALGAMWDPALVEQVGRALGREAHAKSAHVLLAPTVNLHRTPIGGRNFECPSEDPVLAAAVAVAYVRGVQHERVAACIKHFVGNDTEFERMTISSEIDERTLRELYLVPFEAAVREGGVRAIMTGYNKLNGTYCSEHPWLLADVLRGEWGFDGAVVSDWFGTHSAAASLLAGLDIEMPGPPRERGERLAAAVAAGEVGERDLDVAVARLLALGEWAGAATTGTAEVTVDDPETRAVIRRGAAQAMVLLKNDGVLPVAPTTTRVALIGPYARFGRPQGGGSARVRPDHGRGPLEALEARGLDVTFEPGGSIAKYLPTVRGEFRVALTDDAGGSGSIAANRLAWFWDRPPVEGIDAKSFAARITGPFVPDATGDWELGVRAVGPVTVRLDGKVVAELTEAQRGGAFFGMGSPEVRGTVALEEGRRYELEVDYPIHPTEMVRGLVVGARHVPDTDDVARAAAVAAAAELAIVVVGTDDDWETEGEDRTSLALPGDQDELVAAVVAANPNTVVVVNTGSPVTMPWLADVPAVLQLWFPGQEIGDALVDVLTGDVEPGGRLPVTFPARLEDTPAFAHHPGTDGRAVYAEGLFIGHRWYDREDIEPLFPFGFGLGYTTFTLEPAGLAGGVEQGVTVDVDATNTGARSGAEVVQVYVAPPPGDDTRPLRHLAGFGRIELEAGESGRVTVELDRRAFASWVDGAWVVQPGDYTIHVGRSSRHLQAVGAITAPG